ncbi:MAG: hypothetical protein FJ077_04740 [Cyanobacteria bacterium K_DeepCast_35m_m2_023]|nr:hypothetical protein [Cyanobacteria bacterium K_DeepCast_35m_m2_023]
MKPAAIKSNRDCARRVFQRRRPPRRWKQAFSGLLLIALGCGLLVGLMQLPERLDTLLLVSTAIANLISGLGRCLIGLMQLLGVLLLALLAIGALLLLIGGALRLVRALLFPGHAVRGKRTQR